MTDEGQGEIMTEIRVLAIKPFWRWAVVPKNQSDPYMAGMPFYRERKAREWFKEVVDSSLGCFPLLLVRRNYGLRNWGTYTVIEDAK